jgi:hypothetical protein
MSDDDAKAVALAAQLLAADYAPAVD